MKRLAILFLTAILLFSPAYAEKNRRPFLYKPTKQISQSVKPQEHSHSFVLTDTYYQHWLIFEYAHECLYLRRLYCTCGEAARMYVKTTVPYEPHTFQTLLHQHDGEAHTYVLQCVQCLYKVTRTISCDGMDCPETVSVLDPEEMKLIRVSPGPYTHWFRRNCQG